MEQVFDILSSIITLQHVLLLIGASLAGMIVGAVPGLGSVVALSIMLPFTFYLPLESSLIMMIGVMATTNTGDTIPAVIWGIPGSIGAQATILDGYPLAQKGQAIRAICAGYFSSLIGGVIGCVCLLFCIPFMKGLLNIIGSPELLMLGVLGLSMVGVLGGKAPLEGIVMGLLGFLLSMVGQDPVTSTFRWTFGFDYLLDGIKLVPVALGLFSFPEVIKMAERGSYFTEESDDQNIATDYHQILQAIRDVIRYWYLVVRNALIGVFIGILPGVGSGVVEWLAYGTTVQLAKNKDGFGKGDIRGVIAPECSNNAKVGGALITTLFFGIPGSLTMTFVLAALLQAGVSPGLQMLQVNVKFFYLIAITLAFANIIGALMGIAVVPYITKITRIPISYLVPGIMSIIIVASLTVSWSMGDLYTMLGFGLLGWAIDKAGWSRAPVILGFILGPIVAERLILANQLYGLQWLTRPGVMVIMVMIILSIAVGLHMARGKEQEVN